VPADSASEIVKFTISIPRESCTSAKAKYSSRVVPPDPSVHFYHWMGATENVGYSAEAQRNLGLDFVTKQHRSLQKLQPVYSLV